MASQTSGNIGGWNLRVGMSTDAASVDRSMSDMETRISRSTAIISERQQRMMDRNAASHATGSAAKYGSVFQEVGRGFEDFAVSFSMAKTNVEGIAMGLRGASNNIAQMASYAGPITGATVAIGASLATVIVPMTLKWLYNTEETEKAAKRLEEQYKRNLSVAEAIARATSGAGEGTNPAKGPATIGYESARDKIKNAKATLNELLEQEANVRDAAENKKRKKLLEYQTNPTMKRAALDAALKEINEKANAEIQSTRNQAVAHRNIITDNERVTKRLKIDADREFREAAEDAIKDGNKKREEKDRAKLEKQYDLQTKLDEQLEAQNAKTTKSKFDDIQSNYSRMIAEINKSESPEAIKAQQRRTALLTLNKAMDNEMVSQNNKAEQAALDDKITAEQEKINAMQEAMSKSGNANGRSAAMVSGTQSAESAINRALSGGISVENTMKAQLKVEQDILKTLQKQKQLKVASI